MREYRVSKVKNIDSIPSVAGAPGTASSPASGRPNAPSPTVAALFVETGGCYFGLPGVDPWDEARDARKYLGPHPVVAHPPCQRWGRFALGGPAAYGQYRKGDDDGCFAAALAAVRRWGGVLEHPEASSAWSAHGLTRPPYSGAWVPADWPEDHGGWTCCVQQGAYGHKARKATWLYACRTELPSLQWGKAPGLFGSVGGMGFHSAAERAAFKANPDSVPWAKARARAIKTGVIQNLSKRQRAATPHEFRDLLINMARSVSGRVFERASPAERSPREGEAVAKGRRRIGDLFEPEPA